MGDGISVLVVAKPSPLRDSLAALLRSIPLITVVQQAHDASFALRMIEADRPALVLLDAALPAGQAWSLLRQIKSRWPAIPCIVLTDTQQSRRRAEAAGAYRALLKGFPAAKLSLVLEQLLQQVA
jgi:two-component system, NarL family, response regulator DevR